MLELEHVTYGYGKGAPVIRNLSTSILRGRIYGLLGANAAGKTTLLNLMSGLLFPVEGRITMDGRDITKRDPETLEKTALMSSEFQFTKKWKIMDFVRLHSGFYPDFSLTVLEDCLEGFGIDMENTMLNAMSLGQKHKVLFSILLSFGTDLLLLDEPLNGMDMPSRGVFRKMLMKHLREDQTVIISSHTVPDIETLLTDVMILREDGSCFCETIENISARYSFGTSRSDSGAVYSEPCAGGIRVIKEKEADTDTESEVSLELLFNAVNKGIIK